MRIFVFLVDFVLMNDEFGGLSDTWQGFPGGGTGETAYNGEDMVTLVWVGRRWAMNPFWVGYGLLIRAGRDWYLL